MKKLGGWWRLWIALSIIWVCIVAFALLTSSNKYSASDRKRDAVDLHCTAVLDGHEIDWSSVPAEKIEAAMTAMASPGSAVMLSARSDQPHAAASADGWGIALQISAELLLTARAAQSDPPNDARKFIASCLEAKQHDYDPDVVRQRHADMIVAIAVLGAPPLLLLGIGFLVSWVAAGFRRSRSDAR